MSTVRPDTMQSIGTAVAQQGGAFVECPVGGSTGPAKEGKLFGAGRRRERRRRAARCRVLEQLCRRIEHVGALGAGAAMKLAVNLPLLVYWQALGEALTICKPLNLPADRLIDILSDTAGTPTAMKGRGAVIAKVLGRRAARSDGVRPQRCKKGPRDRRAIRRVACTPSCRWPPARSPATRRLKPRALAMPTPPRSRAAGRSAKPSRNRAHQHPIIRQPQSSSNDRQQKPLRPHRRPYP